MADDVVEVDEVVVVDVTEELMDNVAGHEELYPFTQYLLLFAGQNLGELGGVREGTHASPWSKLPQVEFRLGFHACSWANVMSNSISITEQESPD